MSTNTTNTINNRMISYNVCTINLNNISNTNKLNSLKTFVNLMDVDVILFQEVASESIDLYGFEIVYNINHDKRGTAIAYKAHFQCKDVERSIDSRVIKVRLNNNIVICNIYAPSGSSNRSNREHFFNEIVPYYLRGSNEFMILGGDFNSVETVKDSSNDHTSNFSPMLKRLRQGLQLKDAWEVKYGNDREYSFIRGGFGSRIDRIYVSQSLSLNVVDAKYQVTSFTDHKAHIVKVQLPFMGKPFGRGVWNYKSLILQNNENYAEFQQKWRYWSSQRQYYRNWVVWWVEYAKPKVVSFLRWKSRNMYNDFNSNMEFWYYALRQAYNDYLTDPSKISEVNRIKGKMLKLQHDFSAFLARNNEIYFSGEPLSIFHLEQKQQKKNKTRIKSLVIDGRSEENQEAIQFHVVDRIEQLFKSEVVAVNDDFRPEKSIANGSLENEELMMEVGEEEVFLAIKNSASKKSPGMDGLPKEFYTDCWDIIKTEITAVINCMLQGNIEKKMCDGIIVLVKKKNSSNNIDGYRPITLLNFDYKIVSRILKLRLNRLMPSLISCNQKCANPKRNIFEATCSIRDRIVELQHKKRKALLVSFDMEKAFDRVEPGFLFRTLREMNLNTRFVDFLTKVREMSFSKILINGTLSREVKIERSVRQGDPLSMHLFVLYIEPLVQRIAASCSHNLDLINVYADDLSLIVNNLNDLEIIKNHIEHFGLVSGAKLNVSKTKAVEIGFGNMTLPVLQWLKVEEKVKILGIYFSNSIKQMTDDNWTNAINNASFVIRMNQTRKLNLIQKIVFLNTFALSKVWYVASTIKINNKYCAKLKTFIGAFLWQGHGVRVAFNQLVLPKYRGGLSLHDPESKCNSLIIKTFISSNYDNSFIVNQFLNSNANGCNIPSRLVFIKLFAEEIPKLPPIIRNNVSSKAIYDYFIEKKINPEIISKYPNKNWNRIWQNLFAPKVMNSESRSIYYLLINEKIPNMESFYRHGRSSSNLCKECKIAIETLPHIFAECSFTKSFWNLCFAKLKEKNPNKVRYMNFADFQFPELIMFCRSEKKYILECFSKFIMYINNRPVNNRCLIELNDLLID